MASDGGCPRRRARHRRYLHRAHDDGRIHRSLCGNGLVYYGGGGLSGLGAVVYVAALGAGLGGGVELTALAVVGAGQTAGMLAGALAGR